MKSSADIGFTTKKTEVWKMQQVNEVVKTLGEIPTVALIGVVILGAFALSAYAISAVVKVARTGKNGR